MKHSCRAVEEWRRAGTFPQRCSHIDWSWLKFVLNIECIVMIWHILPTQHGTKATTPLKLYCSGFFLFQFGLVAHVAPLLWFWLCNFVCSVHQLSHKTIKLLKQFLQHLAQHKWLSLITCMMKWKASLKFQLNYYNSNFLSNNLQFWNYNFIEYIRQFFSF